MNRNTTIRDIESLYPPDSEYADTAEVGRRLLVQAILEKDRRDLPDDFLLSFLEYCKTEDLGGETGRQVLRDKRRVDPEPRDRFSLTSGRP